MTQFYYTYAYLREDRTPYYIGKGTRYRIYSTQKKVKPPTDNSRIILLKQNLTEEEAFKHERYMIALFGRKDNGTGILRNMTDGGEGVSNQGTPEQRSDRARKGQASRTPEQRSEVARKLAEGRASMTPEQRSERSKKARSTQLSKSTPEQRSEIARKANASMTSEQRSERSKKANASRTPEQRSEAIRRGQANKTPEQRSEAARKAGSQRWQCTVTGYITNSGGLTHYQRARGIDTSNRVRLS